MTDAGIQAFKKALPKCGESITVPVLEDGRCCSWRLNPELRPGPACNSRSCNNSMLGLWSCRLKIRDRTGLDQADLAPVLTCSLVPRPDG